mmetsp:Transcript_95317/g.308794  ORF Transcript_95317/g.308794 Transcript_95317/m.308794 type:complete len:236 (-) Transcript_95317:2873-3580(-)
MVSRSASFPSNSSTRARSSRSSRRSSGWGSQAFTKDKRLSGCRFLKHSESSSTCLRSSTTRRFASFALGRCRSSRFSPRRPRSSSSRRPTSRRSSSISCWLSAYQRSFSRSSAVSTSALRCSARASACCCLPWGPAPSSCNAAGPFSNSRSNWRLFSRQRSSSRACSSARSLASTSSRSKSETRRMLAGLVSALALALLSSATSCNCLPSTSSRFRRAVCRSCLFCCTRLSFSFS